MTLNGRHMNGSTNYYARNLSNFGIENFFSLVGVTTDKNIEA